MNGIAEKDSLPEAFQEQEQQLDEPERVAAATKRWCRQNNCKSLSITVVCFLVMLAVAVALTLRLNNNDSTSNSSTSNATKVFDVVEYLEEHFSVDLPFFHDTQEVLKTYGNLEYDTEQLARYLVANEIFDNQQFVRDDCKYTGTINDSDGNPVQYCHVPAEGASSGGGPIGAYGTHLSPSYGTNNQEASMDRHDFVKSDGTYLYVAEEDGDEISVLLVGNRNGNDTSTTTTATTRVESKIVVPFLKEIEEIDEGWEGYKTGIWFRWTYESGGIKGLLLHNNHLIVLLSGRYDHEDGALLRIGTRVALYEININQNEQPLSNNTDTDTGTGTDFDVLSLTLKEVRDIHGDVVDAYYSTNGILRIVTQSVINKWGLLLEPIALEETLASEMEKEEYVRKAAEWSLYKTIPSFVEKLNTELAELGLDQNLSRFWIPRNKNSTIIASFHPKDYDDDNNDDIYNDGFYYWDNPFQPLKGEFACRITSVHSFALDYGSIVSVPICGYHTNVYAHEDAIILADELHNNTSSPETIVTALWGIRLEGPKENNIFNPSNAELVGVGSVNGAILDSYSLDFYADTRRRPHLDYIRVATTEWDEWGGNSTNTLYVFKFDDNRYGSGGLEMMAQIQMGKPREEFKSLRFLDTIAYAVTFEITDPFYVIDLSVPDDPKILGELEIPGFSEYLHPIDKGRVIGVGQVFDENGSGTVETQVSVFNVSDPALPGIIDRLVIDETGWSEVGKDPRAFRYIASSDDGNGVMVMPVPYPNSNFYVLSVASNGTLTVELVIDHSITMPDTKLWECDKLLPARSFFFRGEELVTFMRTKIIATNLATQEQTVVVGDEHYC